MMPTTTFEGWPQAKEELRTWFFRYCPVMTAHIEAPAGSGKTTELVKLMQEFIKDERVSDKQCAIFYSLPSTIAALRQNPQALDLDLTQESDTVIFDDIRTELLKLHRTSLDCLTLLLDVDNDWHFEFAETVLFLARLISTWPTTKCLRWQRRLVITLRITVTDEEVPKCMVHDDPHHNHTASARSVANSIIQEHQARTADALSSPISEVWLFLPRDGGRYTNSNLVEELKNMDASVAVEPEVPTGIHVRFATLGSRIKPSDTVRHIVLDKSRFRLVWDPTMAFLVYDSVPALRGLLLDQAASLAPGEGRSLVTIHAHQPLKELQQWPHGLEFEDVHLETFLLRTKAAMPSLTPTQMFDAFVTDLSRWDVAIERMDLMGCPLGKTLDERAIRTSQLADIVGYDFSLAYFLSHITNQTSPAVRQAMIDIAAILAVGSDKHRSDFVTYRVEWATELLREGEVPQDHFINLDVNCAGIPDGITSQGAIWLALGIYRKLNGRIETDGPLVSEDGMFDIDTRTGMLIHLYAVEFDSQVTASQGVGSAQLSFEDVETVQREIWRCWFQYGIFRSGSQDEPTCYSVWPGQKTNTSTGVSEASVFDCFYNHDGQDGYWAISFGFLSMDNLKPQYLSSIPDFVVEEWLDERDVIVEELAVDHPFRR